MPTIKTMRMINALESGRLNSTQLEALVTSDNTRISDLISLMYVPSMFNRLINNPYVLNVVCNSYTTFSGIAANSYAMNQIIASSTALATITASSTAMLACWGSDIALNIMNASSDARTSLKASPLYSVKSTNTLAGTSTHTLSGTTSTDKYILLGLSTSDGSTGATITINTKRVGSAISNTYTTGTSFVSNTTAGGNVNMLPIEAPFTSVSTDGSTQTFYLGVIKVA